MLLAVPVLPEVPVCPAVPVLVAAAMLLAASVSDGSFEPQPELITLISATIAKAAAAALFYSWLLLGVWNWVDIGSLSKWRITAASSDRP